MAPDQLLHDEPTPLHSLGSFIHLHSLTHSLTHSPTHPPTHSLTHSLTHSHTLTHSLTHSLIHSLTPSLLPCSLPSTPPPFLPPSHLLLTLSARPQLVPKTEIENQARQRCMTFPDNTTCCLAVRAYEFFIKEPRFKNCSGCSEKFYVFGSRPISLAVNVVCATQKSYPVGLQLSPMAHSTSTLHVRSVHCM